MSDHLIRATYRAEGSHFWWRGFRDFVRPLLENAVNGVADPALLDVGCGTGRNVQMLGEYGRAFGFDFTLLGLKYAHCAYQQTRVAQASATAIPFGDDVFDVVTAFDVLYSLHDDDEQKAIQEIFRVLRPGGAIVVNVAALSILRGNHAVFGDELKRSTRRRLRAVLQHPGFIIERLTYTNATLFPLTLAVRTAQRQTGLSIVDEIAVPPRPLNAVLSTILEAEAKALRLTDMPIGSSLLCLARKPP